MARGRRRAALVRAAGLLAEREEGWGGEAPLEDDSPARALLLSCWLNAAQCALKLEEWYGARDAAGKALALDGASVKALFRRGRALMALGEFGAAKGDLREANRLDPKSREVREAWEACAAAEAAAEGEEKRLASRMAARMVRAVAPAAVPWNASCDARPAATRALETFSYRDGWIALDELRANEQQHDDVSDRNADDVAADGDDGDGPRSLLQ